MFMLGSGPLYLAHMPIFEREDHHYQLTLEVHLDAESMKVYLSDRENYPSEAYNLINNAFNQFTLPEVVSGETKRYFASVFRGYSNADGGTPGPMILSNATVFVDRVVYFRAFEPNIPRPLNLTYVLFGSTTQAFLDHYIAADLDFQQLLSLSTVPDWLSIAQLKAGVTVTIVGKPSVPVRCFSPLSSATAYTVLFQGLPNAIASVAVDATIWYSTGNLLNRVDPCPPF